MSDSKALDALANVRGLARTAQEGVLYLLANLAPDYVADGDGDIENLRPAFSALSALECLIDEASAVLDVASDEEGAS